MASLLEYAMRAPWCLDEAIATRLADLLERHERGEKLADAEIRLIVSGRNRKRAERDERERMDAAATEDPYDPGPDPYDSGCVRVIPVEGVMCRYASMINGTSQPTGTHTEAIIANLDKALADPRCSAILLDFDSPGGSSAGMDDLATAIRDAGTKKPVVAYAHDSMCSAAYWAASQAGQCFASAVSSVGSIGAYVIVKDTSAQAEKAGVKLHLVKAGETKGAGAPGLPVTAADLAVIQERVDGLLSVFVDQALVKGRKMDPAQARKLADGRVHTGSDALKLGLVDGIVGHRDLLKRMNNAYGRGGSPSASLKTAGPSGLGVHTMTFAELKISDPAGAAALEALVRAEITKTNEATIKIEAEKLSATMTAEALKAPANMEQIEAAIPAGVANRDTLILASLKAKHTTAQATAALSASLITANAELTAKNEELSKQLKSIGTNGQGVPALKFGGKVEDAKDFPSLCKSIMAADTRDVPAKDKRADAIEKAIRMNPEMHRAWVQAGGGKLDELAA